MPDMSFALTDDQKALKAAVYDLCKQYSAEYWRELDAKREYPDAFVSDLTKAGYLAQMYIMGTVLRHGTEHQKKMYLPKIATGELRLQAFGVTEPNAGSDTTKLQTTA